MSGPPQQPELLTPCGFMLQHQSAANRGFHAMTDWAAQQTSFHDLLARQKPANWPYRTWQAWRTLQLQRPCLPHIAGGAAEPDPLHPEYR